MGEKELFFRNILKDNEEKKNWHERFIYFLDMMYGAFRESYKVACVGCKDEYNVYELESFINKVKNEDYFNVTEYEYNNYKYLVQLYLFALDGVENSENLKTEIALQGTMDPYTFFLEEKYAREFTKFLTSGTSTDAFSLYLIKFARMVALGGNIDEYMMFKSRGKIDIEYVEYLINKNPERASLLTPGLMQINE